MEIAQWAEADLRVVPRLVDDAAWGENILADEFMLQPGGIDAITEFWNWINDGAGSSGVGLHGDFNMTGSYDEWEQARRLIERGERKLSDYGGELPGIEPPDEWPRACWICSAPCRSTTGRTLRRLPTSERCSVTSERLEPISSK